MMKKRIAIIILTMNMMFLMTGCQSDTAQTAEEEVSTESSTVLAEDIEVEDDSLAESIAEILNNDDFYPDITSIECNDTYTEFTITLSGDTMNMYESMLVMSFYTYGNEKQVEAGTAEEDALTVVRYVNGATGDVISESDSSSMVTE